MLGVMLKKLAQLVAEGESEKLKLPEWHPLLLYFGSDGRNLENYLAIDDAVIWGSLPLLERADDEKVAELAKRLRNRVLYKCFDVGARAEPIGSDVRGRFQRGLTSALENRSLVQDDVLTDRGTVSPYKFLDYESPDALIKIMIRRPF